MCLLPSLSVRVDSMLEMAVTGNAGNGRSPQETEMSEISGHAPFNHWFDESGSGMNMEELTNVPVIELGLPGREGEVKWRFHGKNTVVRVEKVICLAFVDGGETY
ncbi:hypothetical protein Bca52824_056071 [Brassica carinata]|uniref:Xylanase inhibitor C-terminal domain-containing protein n=1 Tax=Brassica carinata TaxID=52824 RepID=A0A8X7UEX6_BRACI|nr:hypothetical protein Bca52824_056071 [Brassica carinata]